MTDLLTLAWRGKIAVLGIALLLAAGSLAESAAALAVAPCGERHAPPNDPRPYDQGLALIFR